MRLLWDMCTSSPCLEYYAVALNVSKLGWGNYFVSEVKVKIQLFVA